MKTFEVPLHYRSSFINKIKKNRKDKDKLKKDFSPTLIELGKLEIIISRHFGFCYGVENAIEIAFKAVQENKGKNLYLISEMIHNPQVNADLISEGIKFITDTKGNQIIPWEDITEDDIVLIPAFGTTIEIENILTSKGVDIKRYDTTCPFVEKVWNRSEKIGQSGFTIIIHGKPQHEETRATFSHASAHAPAVIVRDMEQTILLAQYINKSLPLEQFYEDFKGQYSLGFDVHKDLEKIGVVNQTTMLATDTQAIAEYLKQTIIHFHEISEDSIKQNFADTRDTLCYATNDNQTAVIEMLTNEADLALVIGGYNSSNTSHLVELCEEKLPTYFINHEDCIKADGSIEHFDFHNKKMLHTNSFLPQNVMPKILITSGASCPDALAERVIHRIATLTNATDNLYQFIDSLER